MAEEYAASIEETADNLRDLATRLRRYALLPEHEQTAISDDKYVPQKLSDISKLSGEVKSFLDDNLPPSEEHTPVREKRRLVCPNAPQRKKRLRSCVESLARALVEYGLADEAI